MSQRVRRVFITLNNPKEEDLKGLEDAEATSSFFAACEECGEQGTRHLHVYVEWKHQRAWSKLKRDNPRCRIEQAMGTRKQCVEYICKDDPDPYLPNGVGSDGGQGKRTDIDEIIDGLLNGDRIKDIAVKHPKSFIYHHKGMRALRAALLEPRDEVPEVLVYWGPTGSGKSRLAREVCGDEPRWTWTPARGKWFDGYDGELVVLMEEFRGQLPFGFMLSLLDRYDCPVEFKGGTTEFKGTKIIITSPKHPNQWYHDDGDDKINQLMRRITKVTHMSGF